MNELSIGVNTIRTNENSKSLKSQTEFIIHDKIQLNRKKRYKSFLLFTLFVFWREYMPIYISAIKYKPCPVSSIARLLDNRQNDSAIYLKLGLNFFI